MAAQLAILNEHPKRQDGPSLLHHLVANNGDEAALAIDYQSSQGTTEKISYRQLHRKSSQLARRLRAIWDTSAQPEGTKFIIPLFIPQCPDLYIAQLATLKAGGAFCPMSLDIPEERLRFILRDVDAKILLTTDTLRKTLPDLDNVQLLCVDDQPGEHNDQSVDTDVPPASPAYIMFTSGSTGEPKGVVISHSAATQALLAHDRHIPQFSRFLQFASPTFDVSVFEIFFPFFRHRTLVCGERRQLLSDLPGFINAMDVDAAELTPSVASSLLRGRSSVPRLRTLLTIGEMLKHDVVQEFGGSDEESAVLNGMYGPTEATIHCTLQPAFQKDMFVGNIGIPLETVSAFIVKPAEKGDGSVAPPEVVGVGEEGELAVGGWQLADGYLNRPEQTKAAFVNHPEFGSLYRTGDRAKMTASGNIECLGRISSGQIKLRGQRIELGEIEYAASKTPECQSVVAEVVSGTLVVFLISTTSLLKRSEVFDTCRKWLPAFMVPGDVILLESLPYQASGKVDRKALHAIYAQRETGGTNTDEELSDQLRTILDTLSTILGVSINSSTQLASVGLDSLTAIRAASQLRKAGFSKLDATVLLEARTPQEIMQIFEDLEQPEEDSPVTHEDDSSRPRIFQAVVEHEGAQSWVNDISDVFASTPVQSAMLSETARDPIAYCNWIELAVSSTFTTSAIEQCLMRLAANHSLLRSGFLALSTLDHTHAVVVWKSLLPSQIQAVDSINYSFTIDSKVKLLRPCSFQIMEKSTETRVLLSIHHALYDQWSIDILKVDLEALLHGSNIDPAPAFDKVTSFQRSVNTGARWDASQDYWQDQLSDFSRTSLPLMNSKRMSHQLQRTSWQSLRHSIQDVRSAAQRADSSAPAIVQAALAYLLGSYVGSTDVTYGVVFSGRHVPVVDIERLFGPCLSTLPIRVDYGGTRTVHDLLRLVHDRNRATQKHSFLPISQIKSAANLAPDTNLFDVLVVWQESSFTQSAGNALVREVNSADQHDFSLVIEFEPSDTGIGVRVTYQRSLITAKQVDVLVRQIDALVAAMLEVPDGLVEDLFQSLPDAELSIWNINTTPCAPGHDLVRTIERHASNRPNDHALIFADKFDESSGGMHVLTYHELNSQANQLAHRLQLLKKQQHELVCICMEKSVELYVAILATIKAGCGYLPLLHDVPPNRLTSILAQSKVRLSICDSGTAQKLKDTGAVSVLNVVRTDLRAMSSDNLSSTISGSDVAYTVFTSGSTGEPKGVAVTAENLVGNLQALKELYQVECGDRLLQACSQAFDVSVFEIFFAFYSGICLCAATKDVLFADLEASIRRLDITHLSLTPTVAALIDPANVPQVKFLVTAGEAVTELVHERWAGNGLHQGYGPSETTNICTINMNVRPDDILSNIGPPFRNTSACVLAPGPGFKILPAGAVGEFAFGGEQVFNGYVGMDQLNAEKIINHPRYGRVYKSGDIGRILHDGTLLISGRLDDQVKVRGNRVELGEINAILLQDPDVHDCTTLVVGEAAVEQDLVSFVVLNSSQDRKATTVKIYGVDGEAIGKLFQQVEDALPSYMIPSMVITVNRLPRTSQGKLDRRMLKSLLDGLQSEDKSRFSRDLKPAEDGEEWSETERSIASTLAKGLSIPSAPISRNASFFSFGLNSLNAISFAKHLTKSLEMPVNPGVVLRNPSVARLARHLGRDTPKPFDEHTFVAQPLLPSALVSQVSSQFTHAGKTVEDVLPCTPLQEVMVSASATAGSSYCNTTLLHVTGDTLKLRQCWQDMVERHAILRTRFVETDSAAYPVVQVVLKDHDVPFTWHNSGSGRAPEQQLTNSPKVDGQKPFSVEVYISEESAKLALHMHHAIYDGISMAQLLQEVECRYRGQRLPAPVSFAAFLRHAKDQNSSRATDFWSARLRRFEPAPFPESDSKHDSDEHRLVLEATVTPDQLDSYCRRHGATPLSVFQASLMKVLSRAQSNTDICIGNVVSGRSVPIEGIEKLVAPCFNTIPVRIGLDRARSNLGLIKNLTQSNAETTEYQLAPLRRLQTLSAVPSKRLFDALLLLQPEDTKLDVDIWRLERDDGSMGLPLVVEITKKDSTFNLVIHHLDAVVPESLAERLGHAFVAALKSCLHYPSSDVSHFDGEAGRDIGDVLRPVGEVKGINGHVDSHEQDDDEWNSEETLVREIFARFANISATRIVKDASMYQLGLDSLNAPQIASQLRSKGFSVDAADVMEALTPRAIAKAMTAGKDPDESASIDLEEVDRQHRPAVLKRYPKSADKILKVRPCTVVQNGMIAQSIQSDGDLYINHVTYQLPESVDSDHLHSAWDAVVQKHELLRAGLYNLQDPQWPFLMVVRHPEFAEVPLVVAQGVTAVHEIEQKAKTAVMEQIETLPWRITVSPARKASMTVSMHHALYDAESLRIILYDLQRSLDSASLGEPLNLDPLLYSTIASERQAIASSAAESFWSTTFENVGPIKFPNLNPVCVSESHLAVEVSQSSLDLPSIEHFCREQGVTIQALGQTAWALLLASYAGEKSVMFGTVFSGRNGDSTWQTVFPSVVTIPVTCDTDRAHSDIIQKMVDYNAAAQRHRFTPLADIQRLAGHPGCFLFDTVFVYQKGTSSPENASWPITREAAAVDYAASLELAIERDSRVQFRLTFDTARLPADQAYIMVRQYDILLADIVTGRTTDQHSSQELFSALSAKVQEIPSDVRLLHEFVARGAARNPHRVAVEFVSGFDDQQSPEIARWTYLELDQISNQIAHAILETGARPGSVIALCMEKCPEAAFSFVGILKAGCAFLALDPALPQDRVNFILKDSNAGALLTSGTSAESRTPSDVPILNVDLKSLGRHARSTPNIPKISSEATCYVLYTSGTTGAPKGCEITHENAVQAMLAFQRLFSGHWTEKSRWLQFASYWFDVSVLEHFWSWSVDISVVGAPRDLVLEDIPAFIRAVSITHIDLTPSLARLVHPKEVPSLWGGVFITGGEALKQEIIDTWGSKRTICNGYGPTEATIGVTMNTFIGPDALPSNIGRPFDNVGAYVLGPDGCEPVIRGGVGELCVSGKLVGKGYLNRPDLTSKSFPHAETLGEKIYRTGDLVRLLHDDSFQFIGRQDSQAKLRGQRLEIAEVDTVIRNSTDSIAEVLSLVTKHQHGKETLVSFLTSTEPAGTRDLKVDMSDTARTLVRRSQDACEQKLPGYMVPTHIIPLNLLPLTVNNKVDAKRLSALFGSLDTKILQTLKQREGTARPLNLTERKVCEVLETMFPIDIDQTSSSSNLFSLGLSSISAISFASVLKRAGFGSANVAVIMKNQTIGQLATALSDVRDGSSPDQESIEQARLAIKAHAQRHLGAAAKALHLRAEDIETLTPCTPLQQGLLLESLKNESRPYFNHFEYELHEVDLGRLEQAWSQLLDGAQVLRSSFLSLDEGFSQVIRRRPHAPIYQWTSSSQFLQREILQRRSQWVRSNSGDVIIPLEIHIVTSPTTDLLVLNIHHALYDAISHELMMQTLWDYYSRANVVDIGPSFSSALPYGPLRKSPGSETFWKQRMNGCCFVPLNAGYADASNDQIAERILGNPAVLEKRRQQLGVSHQALAQAAFEIVLRQGATTVHSQTYGVVVSGRSTELERADKILGPMFNTLPQPVTADPSATIAEHTRNCHRLNAEALPHQQTPLRDIRKWANMPAGEPLFDILFVFQHTPSQAEQKKEALYTPVKSHTNAEYPLACEVELHDDGDMGITLIGQGKYFTEEELQALVSDLVAAMQTVIADPDANLGGTFGIQSTRSGPGVSRTDHMSAQVNGVEHFEWTESGSAVRQIVAQLAGLDNDDVDEHSSIFSLGLDSIDAVKLASRLRKAGLPLPVSEILRAQTIPRMLRRMGTQEVTTNGETYSQLRSLEASLKTSFADTTALSRETERVIPATPNQEALVADMLRSDFKEYLNHDVLHLGKDVDIERLKAAWLTVVEASSVLRTSFVQVADPKISTVFAQVIHRKGPDKVVEITLKRFEDIDGYAEEVREDISRNLEQSPPFRVTLATIGEERYLILSLAHALYDGHSLALLHDDVQQAYDGTFKPRPSNDGAVEAALSAVEGESLQYWKTALLGARPRAFPRLREPSEIETTYRSERESKLSAESLRSFCQRHGVSMQALTQTCWAMTLAHYSQATEVTFGQVLACRDSEEAEQIMFPMMNTVFMRSSLHGTKAEMLKYTQSAISEMLPYQRTPLRAIQNVGSDIVAARDAQLAGQLFDTLFIYQHRPDTRLSGSAALYGSVGGASSVEYPVAVEIEVVGNILVIRAACKSTVLDQRGTEQLINTFEDVLQSIVTEPNEQTIVLKDSTASICGLKEFDLRIDKRNGMRDDTKEPEVAVSSDVDTSSIVKDIIEVFAQVSDVSAADLDSASTIESIGIDSISAIKVASLLRKKEIKLSVSEIVRSKSAARLAQLVSTQADQPKKDSKAPERVVSEALKGIEVDDLVQHAGYNTDDFESILPATAGQIYMLSMWQKTGGQIFYPTFHYHLRTKASQEDIATAWSKLMERHTIIRTAFLTNKDSNMPLLQLVLRQRAASQPVDRQPMVTLNLTQTKEGFEIGLKIHHALYDAVSLARLLQDLESLVAAKPISQSTVKQEDFMALYVTPQARAQQKIFWTSYLRDITSIKLQQPALDGPQIKVEIFQPGLFPHTKELDIVARRESISTQALLFAAYAKVYACFPAKTGSIATDVVLGTYLSNRSHLPDLDILAAPTLNLVPLLVRSPKGRDLLDVAKGIQRDLQDVGSLENSTTGLWEIAEWTGVRVDTFVNFLKLPERDGDGTATAEDVRITEISDRRVRARSEVTEPEESTDFEPPTGLKDLATKDAYHHSVDIEMTVTEGKLDVGMFAPVDMLGLEEAEKALKEFRHLLGRVVGRN